MATETVQHTIRGIPKVVDDALRRRSRRAGRSLNAEAVAALARGLGVPNKAKPRPTLAALAGTWQEDPAFDRVMREQDRVDVRLWK